MWALRRFGQHSRQFPQGGINPWESAEQADVPELLEEVVAVKMRGSCLPQLVALQVTKTFGALGHKAGMYRPETKVVSLQLMSADAEITCKPAVRRSLTAGACKLLVSGSTRCSFKRDVYRRVMKEFASVVMALQDNPQATKRACLLST